MNGNEENLKEKNSAWQAPIENVAAAERFKTHKHIIILAVAALATLLFYLWFVRSTYFEGFKIWSQSNLVIYISALLVIKILGIVWPPIPGGIFTLASVPILGWKLAYGVDLLGSAIGSSMAFFIARKWGWQFLRKIFDDAALAKIKRVKIKKEREFETIFLMRIFGGTIVEVVCYGAGVLDVGYGNYLFATILSHLPLGIPLFYAAGSILNGNGAVLSLVFLAFAVLLFYKFKNRYFELQS